MTRGRSSILTDADAPPSTEPTNLGAAQADAPEGPLSTRIRNKVIVLPSPSGRADGGEGNPQNITLNFPLTHNAGAHLGLRLWRSRNDHGHFHFADVRGYRVTAGLPVASSPLLAALHEEFAADCHRDNLKPLHFGMTDAALEFLPPLSSMASHGRWPIGDLPIFNLARWQSDALIPAIVRSQCRRARRRGVTVERWLTPPSASHYAELCAARDAWVNAKPLPPLLFMTTPYLFDPWPVEGVLVAKVRGRIVGFLVASRALFGEMLRVDTVARLPDAPNGTAEVLVREAFKHAADRGIMRATLGLAPLSHRGQKSQHHKARDRWWLGAVSWCARRFCRGLYSFAGLEAFKAKFQPDLWLPLYAVASGSRFTPRDILAVTRVFAGGSIVRYGARACVWRIAHALGRTSNP